MSTRPFWGSFARVALFSRRALAAALLALIVSTYAEQSEADFPQVTQWRLVTFPNKTCDQVGLGVCVHFWSRDAAWGYFASNSPSFGCWAAAEQHQCCSPPDQVYSRAAGGTLDGVCPFGGTSNAGAQQVSGFSCPSNSTNTAGMCACGDGFLETNAWCHGGKNNGLSCPNCGNPVNPANGNKFERQVIYSGPSGFELALSFNTYDDDDGGRFGRRWRDSFRRTKRPPSSSS